MTIYDDSVTIEVVDISEGKALYAYQQIAALVASVGGPGVLFGKADSDLSNVTAAGVDRVSGVPSIFSLSGDPTLISDWSPVFVAALTSGRDYALPSRFNGAVLPYPMETPTACLPVTGSGLIGDGDDTLLQPTFAGADFFRLGDGVNSYSDVQLSGFRIWPTVAQSAGFYALHPIMADRLHISDVLLGSQLDTQANGNISRIAGGIAFDRFTKCKVEGGEICYPSSGENIVCWGNADQSFGAELTIGGAIRLLGGPTGNPLIHMAGGAGGLYLKRIDGSLGTLGLRVSKARAGVFNRELFSDIDCDMDSIAGMAAHVESGALAFWKGAGIWVSGCGAAGVPGVLIEAVAAGDVQVQVSLAEPCVKACVYDGWVQKSGTFNGRLDFTGNGTGAAGGHGFYASAGMIELIADGWSEANGNATRGYGLYAEAGVEVADVAVAGASNGQGPSMWNAGGVSANVRLHTTAGYAASSNGYAVILAGQSSVTFNHGLTQTPSSVEFWPAGLQEAGSFPYLAPVDVTAIQATIHLGAVATATRGFGWKAVRE